MEKIGEMWKDQISGLEKKLWNKWIVWKIKKTGKLYNRVISIYGILVLIISFRGIFLDEM